MSGLKIVELCADPEAPAASYGLVTAFGGSVANVGGALSPGDLAYVYSIGAGPYLAAPAEQYPLPGVTAEDLRLLAWVERAEDRQHVVEAAGRALAAEPKTMTIPGWALRERLERARCERRAQSILRRASERRRDRREAEVWQGPRTLMA